MRNKEASYRIFLKVDCDPGVDFYHFQMCGTDKQLCTVRDSLRRSLENKNPCVSFVAVAAPMGPSSSEVVCAGGLAGGEGPPYSSAWHLPEPGVFLRLSSLVSKARKAHSLLTGEPRWNFKLTFFL